MAGLAGIVAEWPASPPGRLYLAFQMSSNVHRLPGACRAFLLFMFLLVAGAFFALTSGAAASKARNAATDAGALTHSGVEIVEDNHYPELRVDGTPFFIHSAAFFYYRIPRDQWEPLLDRYSSLGVNTIDLYIPWNWHEPKPGEFDFDGHTNPRRNLRALLSLIARKHLRLIARPGPEILNEWRNGGYPDWLLQKPEYKMSREDVIEGRYPPLDGLNARDAESAAQGWLANAIHMTQTRAWFAAVGKELALFSSHRLIHGVPDDSGKAAESSGPLLFVQIGDDFAEGRANRVGPDFWRYCEDLAAMLEAAGVDVPIFINPTDARIPPAGSGLSIPIGVMGQWYMQPQADAGPQGRWIDAQDAGEIELDSEELATQPSFPPAMIEYQAGWYAPGFDDRPPSSPPGNTLLGSRLLIANGIQGFNYFPLQDTFTPAGYSVPWANRFYRWNAALDPNGEPQARLQAVQRNSRLLRLWGPQIAASHKRVDFGIIATLAAYPQGLLSELDVLNVSDSLMRLERLATLAMFSTALRDPEYQSVEQLQSDPALFLFVPDPSKPQFQLSDRAQTKIVEYVRRGGTLVVFPEKPRGEILRHLWQNEEDVSDPGAESGIHARWKFGDGEVIECTRDFLSWIAMDASLSGNRAQQQSGNALEILHEIIAAAGIRPAIELSGNPAGFKDVVASELVTNDGTGPLGERHSGAALFSVTNLSEDETTDADFEVLPPSASARKRDGAYLSVHVNLPPHESMLLPIEDSLCAAPALNINCKDEVVSAGAELVDVKRDGKVLELTFYDPLSAEVAIHVAQHPSHVTLESTTVPEAHWVAERGELDVTVPRGPAPDFLRVLRLDLPYTPSVPEIPKPAKSSPSNYEASVWNAMELPLTSDTFLKTYPPLVEITSDETPAVMLSGVNRDAKETHSVNVSVAGPLRGSGSLDIPAEQSSLTRITLKPSGADAMALKPESDGLLHGTIRLRSGRDQRTIPIDFVQEPEDSVRRYRFDFDRDGNDEWVLESGDLRLILSPESGGRVIALTGKSTGVDLTTSVGLLRDSFSLTENPAGGNPQRARGRYGLFNCAYTAEPVEDSNNPGIMLRYEASDVFPAGASIRKSVRLDGADTVAVSYIVFLSSSATGAPSPPQSFIAINSFPALAPPLGPTRFCWRPSQEPGLTGENMASEAGTSPHCEDFVPGGKPIEVPEGVLSVQIHTPARAGVEISWTCADECARLRIEPQNFSALFRLQFPPLTPGKEALYSLRFRAIDLP